MPEDSKNSDVKVIIYTINDVYEIDNMGKIRHFIDEHRAKHKPTKDIITLPGDFLSPSALSLFDKGENMVKIMNKLGVQIICLGNHEFDFGYDLLRKRLEAVDALILNTNIEFEQPQPTINHTVVEVEGYRMAFAGFCATETQSLLEISTGKKQPMVISEVNDVAQAEIDAIRAKEGKLDYFVALTHQFMPDDRKFAKTIKGVDVVLGGHDHVPFMEEYEGMPIIKVGQNATHCGVVTITFDGATGKATTTTEMFDVTKGKSEPSVQALVDDALGFLKKMQGSPIYQHPKDAPLLSSKGVRLKQTTMGALLCDLVKCYYQSDVCMIAGGKIRAAKDYPDGSLTCTSIKSELPFDNYTVSVKMTGAEITEAVRYSRVDQLTLAGFLQLDSGTVYDEKEQAVVSIGGKPLSKEAEYLVCVPLSLLKGMDHNPVLTAVGEKMDAKNYDAHDTFLLQNACMVELINKKWEEIKPSFFAIDTNHDNVVTREEFRAYMEKTHVLPSDLWDVFFDNLDDDHDGTLSLEEYHNVFAEFTSRSDIEKHVERKLVENHGSF